MLVKYIRKPSAGVEGRGTPIGCIVALDKTRIGYSFCSPKEKKFDRKMARELAAGRAALGTTTTIPNRFIDLDCHNQPIYLEKWMEDELYDMTKRAERYFKA